MPNGFVGNASHRYLSQISEAMESANTVHNSPPAVAFSAGSFHQVPHSPGSARSGGYVTGVGDQSNIVVKHSDYNEILGRIQSVDSKIAEECYNICVQIEEMCDTIYVVPIMKPKYVEYTNRIKACLAEFQSLTDDARMRTHQFVSDIVSIDNR